MDAGSVLKSAGYKTYFTGKWHLGEADYSLPNAQGYDVMEPCFLYHCNAYKYGDPTWFPDMDPSYAGPITLSSYFRFLHIREQLEKEGVKIPIPTGN